MAQTDAAQLSVTIMTTMIQGAEVVDEVQIVTAIGTVAEAEAPDEDVDVDAAVAATARDSTSHPRSLQRQNITAPPCPKWL